MTVDMSPKAVTVRLQRVSQLRALCLSLAAAGRRAKLAPRVAQDRCGHMTQQWGYVPRRAEKEAAEGESGGDVAGGC